VDDIKNPMLAGALVGAMSEIPVLLRSKVITKADVLLAEQVCSYPLFCHQYNRVIFIFDRSHRILFKNFIIYKNVIFGRLVLVQEPNL